MDQTMLEEDIFLSTLGRHVPRVLKNQLISKLANQYATEDGKANLQVVDSVSDIEGDSTISRFHSAMLFVDISGFTVLSQKLKVDDLKVQINNYFELIVSIILKYDGEIIKFAGDAIFVIFQTKINNTADPGYYMATKEVIDTAVVCGKEVLAKCGHYPVELGKNKNTDSTLASMELFESMDAGLVSSTAVSKKSQQNYADSTSDAPTVTYLDVHCGVSVGTMAGIDVGAAGRYEYLIMGQPMSDVAIAEGDAGKGELVISPEVHSFLHRYAGPMPSVSTKDGLTSPQKPPASASTAAPQDQPAPAPSPAKKTAPQVGDETGFFCFRSRRTPQVFPTDPTPAPVPADAAIATAASVGYFHSPTKPDTPGDILPCGCCVTPSGYFKVNGDPAFKDPLVGQTRLAQGPAIFECKRVQSNVNKSFNVIRAQLDKLDPPSKAWTAASAETRSKVVEAHYLSWARDCLVDDIAHHVHEVSRENYSFTDAERYHPLSTFLSSEECENALRGDDVGFMNDRAGSTDQGKTAESLQTISELRNVIVMFINVKMDNSTVFLDPAPKKLVKTCAIDEFNFLSRTEAELEADKALRNKFQSCFAVMAQAFSDKGGQVRQFIVDDKGTVCIGTFGLRGAVNYDNAAASVETAELIINGLNAIGIGASIGLTSGTGYCGLVGSVNRHEYAVMGPSVNLSARLMCRAALGEAICDADTRNRDRLHNFTTLQSVQAKGYAHLVPTFKPNFNMISDVRSRSEAPDLSVNIKQVNKLGKKQLTRKNSFLGQQVAKLHKFGNVRKLHGREQSMRDITEFLFPTKDTASQERFMSDFFAALEEEPTSPSKAANGGGGSAKQSVMFDVTQPTRLVSMVGPHGIGKTSMLDLFQDKMARLSQANKYNLTVFRHRVGYVNTSSPFSAFMCMIFHMMFYTSLYWAEHIADEATRKAFVPGFNNLGVAIEYTFSKLSPELQRFRPLLCDLHLLPPEPDNEVTELLKGKERLYRTADLLAGFIQQYSLITGNFALMIMDDIQNNDSISQYLFKKVWTELTGIGILSTYRPKGMTGKSTTGMSTPNSVSSRATTRASSSDFGSIADIPIVDFLAFMSDTDVFRRVDLQTIDKAASKALVADIFELFDITDIDDTVYDKMYELSGGNPLYASELTKGIAQKRSVMADTQMSSASLNKLLAEMRTVRVEEVVYYRFDQLDPDWQIVLKVAAVAASNNAPFTAPMLQYMLDHDKSLNHNQDAAREDGFDLSYIINYMLSMNEFIYIKNMSIAVPIVDRGNAHTEFEPDVFNALAFAWHFIMEQKAVYDLMLDEQKVSLHKLMVEYLQSTQKEPTTNDLFELAHHMDLSRNYTGALRCYYQSGCMLHTKGADYDALKHFTAAQRMLAKLRAAVGITDEKNGWKSCTAEKMQEVFGTDTAMVEIAIQSVLRTAQSLLIFRKGEVEEQLAKLAHRNARTFFEQALGMITHVCDEKAPMQLDFASIAATFWECIAAGDQTVPEGVQALSRAEALAAMTAAVNALKASAPIAEEGEDEGDTEGAAAPQ